MTRRSAASRGACVFVVVLAAAVRPAAQTSSRLAVLIAEDRRAPTLHDLATIRSAMHSRDPETARVAVRALGRLERPELVADLVPMLKAPLPEIRAEAANAVAQAAQGWRHAAPPRTAAVRRTGAGAAPNPSGVDAAAAALANRLHVEDEGLVRGALTQALGRLPYTTAEQVRQAETTLTEALVHEDSTDGRLGIAQGLEALVRLNHSVATPSSDTIARLVDIASGSGTNGAARVRRLALEALITANAVDDPLVRRAAADADPQVRRLAMRAAGQTESAVPLERATEVLTRGLADPAPMVRIEAVRGLGARARGTSSMCSAIGGVLGDRDTNVALVAIDQLASCGADADAVGALNRLVDDGAAREAARGWHRSAHAIVALAAAAPDRAKTALPGFVSSAIWQVRMYAARAAGPLGDRAVLEKLAADGNDNVCEAAIVALSKTSGHQADAVYAAALSRPGYQAIREAARALAAEGGDGSGNGTASDATVAALKTALQRLDSEGHDNSRDARAAIIEALERHGAHAAPLKPVRELPSDSDLTAEALHRLAGARARVTIRGVGAFEVALFASQAPATCIRFAHLAESAYYNGLTVHRVVPDFVIQGGSPGANEYVGDAAYMRDEVGMWPHVRGALGISTRGRDTGDAQIFVDLVDNPRLDHEYTVFGQVLSGLDVVDQILEGDVIEKIEILTS